MGYIFIINIAYLNLNFIFNILNAIMNYWLLANKCLILKIEPHDFLKNLTIWASFSYKLFLIKKTCNL